MFRVRIAANPGPPLFPDSAEWRETSGFISEYEDKYLEILGFVDNGPSIPDTPALKVFDPFHYRRTWARRGS